MKNITKLLLVALLFITTIASAQYGIGTTSPSPSAQLELNSTAKGFLMPRMTTVQRDAIASPAAGLMIYNLETNKPNFFNGVNWIELAGVIVGGATQPGVPTGISVTPGNTQAFVAFTAPTNNGGSPITNYIVTANPGALTASGADSPITVTGLVNGTAYTFSVVAVNAIGNSASSTVSTPVTPVGAPGAPTSIVASYTAGTTQASIAFTAPTNNGGAAITGYTVTSNPGGLTASGASSPLVVTGLLMNQAYTFTVVASNGTASVASAASNSITTVPVVPTAPLNLVASSSASGTASIAFGVPASNGGATITNYVVTSNPAGGTGSGSASPIAVSGLTDGIEYTFTLVATNSAGNSPASAASNAVIPVGAPGAPTSIVASYTAGTTQASIAFTAPTNNGGAAITGYTVTSNPGGLTATGASSPLVVTGLSMNQAYTFSVVANNGSASVASADSNSITTVPVVPTAPLNLVASSSASGTASIAFGVPASNGGATITNYVVTSNPAGGTGSGSASPIAVSGLTDGISYTFTLVATNSAGNSPASAASNAVTPVGAPGAPTSIVASYTAGTTQASIAFTAPTNNGGAAITGYTVTSTPGGLTATGASSPLVVTGLSMNQAYTFTVVANNGSTSVASAASNSITPIPVAPSAPLNLVASSTASGSASIAFDVPTLNGGAAITNYVVTSNPAGGTGSGSASPIAVSGLTDGISYTFTLVATNSAGNSPASAASNPVTPVGAPGAPTSIVASYTAGTTESSVAFTAPTNNGGAAITGYTVTSNPGGLTATGASSPLVVTGLSMNQAYTFTVVANNGSASVASAASNSITTVPVVPTAPLNLVASSTASGSASIAFDVPTSNGGAAITNYVVTSNPAGGTGSGSASPIAVSGLTNGISYTFTLVATNSAGNSPASAASNAVTPVGAPSAPTSIVASYTAGTTESSVAFTAPTNNGGAAITGYTVTSNPGGLTATGASSPLVVSGLTIGTTYTFTVVANNGTSSSIASTASNQITPQIAAPGTPLKLAVLPGNNTNTLTWQAPTTGGPVQNYIVQERKDLGAPTTWTTIATLGGSTLNYTHLNITNVEGVTGLFNTSQNYYYRIVASNTTGTANSIEAAGYPLEGTVLVHDNFNNAPSTPIWESVTSLPATIAGQSATDRFSFTDAAYINRLYGQVDGKWKIVKPVVGNTTNCIISATAGLIDRTLNNATVLQFSFSPVNGGTYQSWGFRFGLVDQNGRTYSFFVNNPATGVTPGTADGDWPSLGVTNSSISRNAGGFLSSTSIPGTMHVRIILPASGGMKIRINGASSEWTATEIPPTFNNLKFFVMAGKLGDGTTFQTIDNFTITRY